MTGEDADFDALIASLDPAMAVVTTVADGERAGCLIGFHAQSSVEPHRYVVWLSKANHTFRVGVHAQHFAIHFLSEDDLTLAGLFGTESGDQTDKFARCDWEPGVGGVPLLSSCPRRFTAARVAMLDDGGDHVCLVLAPVQVGSSAPFRPLRLSGVDDLQPGHAVEERPQPVTERAG